MGRLEQLVAELEAGELPLEQALARFEEGVRLARLGAAHLERAERRVEELLGDEASDAGTVPFEEAAEPPSSEESP